MRKFHFPQSAPTGCWTTLGAFASPANKCFKGFLRWRRPSGPSHRDRSRAPCRPTPPPPSYKVCNFEVCCCRRNGRNRNHETGTRLKIGLSGHRLLLLYGYNSSATVPPRDCVQCFTRPTSDRSYQCTDLADYFQRSASSVQESTGADLQDLKRSVSVHVFAIVIYRAWPSCRTYAQVRMYIVL